MSVQPRSALGKLFVAVLVFNFAGALAVGLYLSVWGAWEAACGRSSSGWPVAEGAVESTEVLPAEPEDGPLWLAGIVYAYEVDGKRFRGHRQRYDCGGSYCGDTNEIVRYLAKYPAGGRTAVRYDPRHPSRSVLEPGIQRPALLMLAGGLAFILGAGVMVAIPLRAVVRSRQREDPRERSEAGCDA